MFNFEDVSKKMAGAAKFVGKKTWSAAKITAKYGYEHREQIGGAVVGMAKGVGETGKGVYGYTISKEKIEEQVNILTEQAKEYKLLTKNISDRSKCKSRKDILLDSLVSSSAVAFEYYKSNVIPHDIVEAYTLAYPEMAKEKTIEEVINQSSAVEAAGYINGIKGKLFELRYADYLNESGLLPDGYHAELARSAINPGWDLAIVDNYGNIADTLQLKASENVAYIKEALERYPDIDVVTTSEVYNQLAMTGMADNVVDSGISNAEITDMVVDTFSKEAFDFDWYPSIVMFLIIGYSVSRKQNLSNYQKGKEFGGRAVSSWIGYLAGGAVTGLTGGFWVAGIAAAILTNCGLEYGRQKYKYYNSMKNCIKENRKILNRLKLKLSLI